MILPRIFDPFFSTKKTGSGLGLATAYSIIKRHQGCIEAHSAVGQGATFILWLPAAGGVPKLPSKAPLSPASPAAAAPLPAARVLLMEASCDLGENILAGRRAARNSERTDDLRLQ